MDFRPAIAAAIAAAILFGAMVAVRDALSRYPGVRGSFFLAILALFTLWVVSQLVALRLDTMIAAPPH